MSEPACDHCARYVEEVKRLGENVLSTTDGTDIHLCEDCIEPFMKRDTPELCGSYLAALLVSALEDKLDKGNPRLFGKLCSSLASTCLVLKDIATYRIAYKHGSQVEHGRQKWEGK